MNRFACMALGLVVMAAGCGDDGGGDPVRERGFTTPMTVTKAYDEVGGVWQEQGNANFGCLNTATDDTATTLEVTLTGTVEDFQTGNAVPGATVTIFDDVEVSNPFATVTSDENGDYTATIPAGTTRFGFKMVAEGQMETLLLNQYLDPNTAAQSLTIGSVSELTANALPAFIGVTRTAGRGVLAGAMRDCDNNEVGGAIATVSSVSGSPEHLDATECTEEKPCTSSYYFSAGSTSLPVRHSQQAHTNFDGLFMTIELPPNPTSYLQVWGFTGDQDPASDDLTLLAEIASPVLADVMVTFSLEPLRN
ncbi:MAG TPA: carboxypeptidase-like regulatory domain-containing protein [Kofleriaceae bacterium]|nr:carboxypeptidase-like regulatory domain-containing protein [Kofleriaceae bacterium]